MSSAIVTGMKKILVVDDERATTLLLGRRLEETGRFEVRTANSGPAALVTAQEYLPDLILLDVMMPELEGDEVAARLKANPKTAGIPVVFLTSLVQQEEIGGATALVIGGNRFLAKPIDPEKVIECVDEVLDSPG